MALFLQTGTVWSATLSCRGCRCTDFLKRETMKFMARRSTPRNPLFDGRWFEDEIIILCLRWYFRYRLLVLEGFVEIPGRSISQRGEVRQEAFGREERQSF